MYIKSPGAGVGWGTFIEPFTPGMWVSTLAIILLGALAVAVTYHIGKKLSDVEDLPFTFGTTVFISFSGFFQQGNKSLPIIFLYIYIYKESQSSQTYSMFCALFSRHGI